MPVDKFGRMSDAKTKDTGVPPTKLEGVIARFIKRNTEPTDRREI